MRTILTLLLALLATPALAQGWDHYANAKFGYELDIPPGFVGQGESDYGDGQIYLIDGRPIRLLVWANQLMEVDLEAEAGAAIGYTMEDGWDIADQTVTPRWARFTGQQDGRALYQRLVLLCDGSSYAAFRMDYAVRERAEMAPLVARIEESLRGSC